MSEDMGENEGCEQQERDLVSKDGEQSSKEGLETWIEMSQASLCKLERKLSAFQAAAEEGIGRQGRRAHRCQAGQVSIRTAQSQGPCVRAPPLTHARLIRCKPRGHAHLIATGS